MSAKNTTRCTAFAVILPGGLLAGTGSVLTPQLHVTGSSDELMSDC
jgi:hypothetical protein